MRAREVANVVETCTGDDMLSHYLPYLLEQLESCQKSLTGYLGEFNFTKVLYFALYGILLHHRIETAVLSEVLLYF